MQDLIAPLTDLAADPGPDAVFPQEPSRPRRGLDIKAEFIKSLYKRERFLFILVCLSLTALTATGIWQSKAVYYPELDMRLFSPWGLAGAAAFTLLSVLPLIINIKEAIRWRLLLSKT